MKKAKNLTSKKLLILIVGFVLLLATVSGILFGANRNARAALSPDGIEITQRFVTEVDVEGNEREETVTDDGPSNNPATVFDCRQFPSVGNLLNDGYKYVTVSLEFMMREVNDGNQIIFLCPGSKEYRVSKVELDYCGNSTGTTYNSVFVGFASFPLDSFVKNGNLQIALRYDASGSGSDTWKFKKMNFKVEISKTRVRANNIIT